MSVDNGVIAKVIKNLFIKKLFHHVPQNDIPVRSSRPEVFCKKGVLRNFVKFTGKHLCQSLFFKETLAQVFSVNFAKFLRKLFLLEHLW